MDVGNGVMAMFRMEALCLEHLIGCQVFAV